MHSRQQLTSDFLALGMRAGHVVMLHASVHAVGAAAGGPDDIHRALEDAPTRGSTLFMYAGCPRYLDEVGRGGLSAAQAAEVLETVLPFGPDTARADRLQGRSA